MYIEQEALRPHFLVNNHSFVFTCDMMIAWVFYLFSLTLPCINSCEFLCVLRAKQGSFWRS